MHHGTLVLIKQNKQFSDATALLTVYKLTVLLKHVNPSIKFVATTENTHYNIKPFDSCSQKVISIIMAGRLEQW